MSRYPLTMSMYGHGDLTAHTGDEERAFEQMGWVAQPTEPAKYQAYPCWLHHSGDEPDRLVSDAQEASQAAREGWVLPDDAQLTEAKESFEAAFEPDLEVYEPERYPLRLRHPDHREAVPMKWRWYLGPSGHAQATAIPPVPEHLPDVEVDSAEEEAEWAAKGWVIGAAVTQGAAEASEGRDPTDTSPDHEEPTSASPPSIVEARKRPSGAAWRRRRRETQSESPQT
jgi:hypothetical protein